MREPGIKPAGKPTSEKRNILSNISFELLNHILNLFEITACITGFIYWNKIKKTHWKYFPFYLGFIVLIELTGRYLAYTHRKSIQQDMYNYLAIPLQILFFNLLFYFEFSGTRFRRLPLLSGSLYLVCWLAESFLIGKSPFKWINSSSYAMGVILLVILALAFFYLLVTTGNAILNIKSNMMFRVSLSIIVFYLVSLPFFGIGNYLVTHHRSVYYTYALVVFFLNYTMYLLFTTAFIWGKPKSSFLLS
jgi:hypothetical protein